MTFEDFCGHADGFDQRRMRMDCLANVGWHAAHFDRQADLADQIACVGSHDAAAANEKAARLGAAVEELDGVELVHPVEANGVFARLPREAIERLMGELPGEHPFYVWDEDVEVVRWMCSWDTTDEDVETLVDALRASL